MKAKGISDIGKNRKNNEDAIFVPTQTDEIQNLYIVADGMGGCNAGEVASHIAIEAFVAYIRKERKNRDEQDIADLLTEAAVVANKAVYEKSNTDKKFAEMGTTLVVASVVKETLYIVYAGDSRAYLYRSRNLMPLTTDHSYVMELVNRGRITKEEASVHPKRNVITRAVGIDSKLEVDMGMIKLLEGDTVLLCTDGLSGMLSDTEIEMVLKKELPIEQTAKNLVDKANEKGGYDNISVILVDIGGNH